MKLPMDRDAGPLRLRLCILTFVISLMTAGAEAAPRATRSNAYLQQLKEGRRLAAKGLWADAVKAFAKALKASPNDGTVLGELGWAAFKSGDYPAAKTATEKAVQVARTPTLKAAVLYNLGRTAEAMGDKAAATAHYTRSLSLRPHPAIAKRLADLGVAKPAIDLSIEATRAPCRTRQPDKELCPCLEKWARSGVLPFQDDITLESRCNPKLAVAGRLRAVQVEVGEFTSRYQLETRVLLYAQHAGQWVPVGTLGHAENSHGSILNIDNRVKVTQFSLEKVGSRQVLRAELQVDSSEDWENEMKFFTSREKTLCVIPDDAAAPIRCPLKLQAYSDWDENSPDGDSRNARPTQLDVKLSADGTATVLLKPGSIRTRWAQPLLGPHKLW